MKRKILIVAEHNCIRVSKQAYCLNDLGYELSLFTTHKSLRNYGMFKQVGVWDNKIQFEAGLKHFANNVDLIHVHNEPTWHVPVITEILGKRVIVQDFHDMQYWRTAGTTLRFSGEKISWYDEDLTLKYADAFVVPSPKAVEDVKKLTDKPVVFLPAALPKLWYHENACHFRGGLVSQGGHMIYDKSKPETKPYQFRDYMRLYKYLVGKVDVYAYSPSFTIGANDPLTNAYAMIGVNTGLSDYHELIALISSHSWNLVGNWLENPTPIWDNALPNKFYEAIAAGTPSVVFNCPEVKKIVEEHEIGMAVEHPQELIDRWEEHKKFRENLVLKRRDFCMENYISTLTDLYDQLLN